MPITSIGRLIAAVLLAVAACAQVVHVGNYHGHATYRGRIARLIDWDIDQRVGTVDGFRYQIGADEIVPGIRPLTLSVELRPGEVRSLDFSRAVAGESDSTDAAMPPGAWPSIAGVRFPDRPRSATVIGGGLAIHWRTRVGPMLVCDLWGTVYPGQTHMTCELQVTACNPDVPDIVGVVPEDFELSFGPGTVTIPLGAMPPAGTTIATSQGWPAQPFVVALVGGDIEAATAAGSIACVALSHVWPNGNPEWRGSALAWSSQYYGAVTHNLGGWTAGPLGIVSNAHVTGGEWDQIYPGGALTQGARSLGAELVLRNSAYGFARRPGHWLEADGEPLRIDQHPGLSLYGAMPHRVSGVGTRDVLGKPRNPNTLETHNWVCWEEHEYAQTVFAAWRATGSPALQWQIQCRARKWLFEQPTDPALSTTWRTGPPRSWAWKTLAAVGIYENCTDRALAEAVADRWRLYWEHGGRPRWGNSRFWDVRNDPRLGSTEGWIAYQCAVAAYATQLAGEVFDVPTARDAALIGAQAILDHAISRVGETDGVDAPRWRGWHVVWLDGGNPPAELRHQESAVYGPGTESWMMGTAPWVVLRHDPENAKALAVWRQNLAEWPQGGRWTPPGGPR